jgi:hypothetical protein
MKLECEWGLGLNCELQAMILGVTTLGFGNQDLMVPNLSKLSTPPQNVGEFFRLHPLNFFLCVFLCIQHSTSELSMLVFQKSKFELV